MEPVREGAILENWYRLGRFHGGGGMGAVYEAEHLAMGRRVALKLVAPSVSHEPTVVARFQREARADPSSRVGAPRRMRTRNFVPS
jgi:serine/threonine-protein kinase